MFSTAAVKACAHFTLPGWKLAEMQHLWCCCWMLTFLEKAGDIKAGRSVNTPTPAALIILLRCPLLADHAAQQPGGKQVLLWAPGSYEWGSSRKPTARTLAAGAALFMEGSQQNPELVSVWAVSPWPGWCSPEEFSPGLQSPYSGWRSCLWP